MSGHTEATVLDALRRRHARPGNGGSGEYVFLTHVRCGTGWDNRCIDALVIDCYPSRGHDLHAIEVKVSRSDWLRELAQPEKSAAFTDALVDRFSVAAPAGLIKRDELPTGWGLFEIGADNTARQVVKASAGKHLPPRARDRADRPLPKPFVVALLRAAGAAPGSRRAEALANTAPGDALTDGEPT